MQKPWKFAVFGDSQGDNKDLSGKSCINERVLGVIAADIANEHPDLVLVTGDLVNGWFRNGNVDFDAQFARWKVAMGPVYKAWIPVYPVRGNHENGPERLALPPLPVQLEPPQGTEALLKDAFIKAFAKDPIPLNGPQGEEGLTYSFTHKNALMVGLDQFSVGQHRINQAWLDRELVANTLPHVFVFSHEPVFEVHQKDNMSFFEKERDNFWDSIGKAGGRVYFCGHDHFYNRSLILDKTGNPVWQIIVGTGGKRLTSWHGIYKEPDRVKKEYADTEHHGYLLVTVDGLKVTVEYKGYSEDGEKGVWKIYDSFSYTVHGASKRVGEDRWKRNYENESLAKAAYGD